MRLIDLRHLGRERVIGSWLIGDVIVDPGPASCLERLLDGIGEVRPRALALTHIHLDHAGGTGSLVRHFPEIEVWVHERGAKHIVDPSKLLQSAGRLYGKDMERLWGEVLPVPAEQLRVLSGGERIGPFRVAYTPGHASHHVSYLHDDSGCVFGGDVTGVRISERGPVLAPTPPPDIDLKAWRRSLDLIEQWSPSAVICTHFGLYSEVSEHLAKLRACLDEFERRALLGDRDLFIQWLREEIASSVEAATAAVYEQAMAPSQSFEGLERCLRGRR
jgi:glyoxylase-like metal-dependent hydrolase (beta-lactamase superfamily II)